MKNQLSFKSKQILQINTFTCRLPAPPNCLVGPRIHEGDFVIATMILTVAGEEQHDIFFLSTFYHIEESSHIIIKF